MSSQTEARQGAESEPGQPRYCGSCGAPLTAAGRYCPACGLKVDPADEPGSVGPARRESESSHGRVVRAVTLGCASVAAVWTTGVAAALVADPDLDGSASWWALAAGLLAAVLVVTALVVGTYPPAERRWRRWMVLTVLLAAVPLLVLPWIKYRRSGAAGESPWPGEGGRSRWLGPWPVAGVILVVSTGVLAAALAFGGSGYSGMSEADAAASIRQLRGGVDRWLGENGTDARVATTPTRESLLATSSPTPGTPDAWLGRMRLDEDVLGWPGAQVCVWVWADPTDSTYFQSYWELC